MRQRSRWKIVWCLTLVVELTSTTTMDDDDSTRSRNVQKSLFYPRMDYDQWKPLGRGDPLKNDPTFDYVPPVLDHVHYWMDPEPRPQAAPSHAGQNGQKTEILLLGVSSKKPAASAAHGQNQPQATDRRDTVYEPYHKYHQDKSANFYNPHSNQRIARPNYFPSMTSQIIPSLMSLANQVLDRTVYSKGQDARMPYTILMPPPMIRKEPGNGNEPLLTSPMTQRPFAPSQPLPFKNVHFSATIPAKPKGSVSVQESNLIYQSSSLGDQKEFESVPSISWELASTTEPIRSSFTYNHKLSPPKPFIKIQFSPQHYSNKNLEASNSNHNVNYVTPPPLDDSKMASKEQASDENDISASYIKMEKPQAQVNHLGVEINKAQQIPIIITHPEPFRAPNVSPPVSMQTIRDMETMKPPPVTQSPVYTRPTNPVVSILTKEHVKSDPDSTNYIASSSSISNSFATTQKPDVSSPLVTLATVVLETSTMDAMEATTIPTTSSTTDKSTITTTSTTTTESVTTMQTLTTDPLFKHYKQPAEPMRGPMYLIIQGHSKVKTYKPAKQIDGIMIQETNEIPYLNDKNVDYSIKHLHGYEKKEDFLERAENIAKQRQARTGNLQTLKHVVETGLGAIDFSKEEAELRKRSDVDLEETELEVGYEVVDGRDVTSEKYHKGIVEEARKLA